ncbi:MAG: M23 family metallopeptidase [Caulobacterales bacterium]
MFGFLRGLLFGAVLIAAGWFMGSIYPAPPELIAPVKKRSDILISQIDFSPQGLAKLRASLSTQEYAQLGQDAARLAASSGNAVIVEHDPEALEDHAEAVEAMQAQIQPAVAPGEEFENSLALCPRMTVSNAPPTDANGVVKSYAKFVRVNGVSVAVNPTHGACLSSMFGPRSGRLHKGIDLYSIEGGPILAAGDGVILEKKYRDDYGNMLLIDHGKGVYTRYAHLSSFADGTDAGAKVTAGQQIGLMGNTAAYRIPVHLHYEVLLGDYKNPKGSFGLTPESVFAYPKAG